MPWSTMPVVGRTMTSRSPAARAPPAASRYPEGQGQAREQARGATGHEELPPGGLSHRDAEGPRSRGRPPAASMNSKTSRLHVSRSGRHGGHVRSRRERAGQLVALADRDRSALGVRDEDDAQVDRPDVGGVVVEQGDGSNAGSKSASSSSRHSRRKPPSRPSSPGLRCPPTPIDHRSCSRWSAPARVRRIRK